MGIRTVIANALGFGGVLRAAQVLESPWADSSHLAEVTLAHLYGLEESTPVTRSRAMRIPTISKARRIIAPGIGRLPLVAYDAAGNPLVDQPAFLAQPEKGITRITTLTWTADELMFYPFTFWQVTQRDWRGFPRFVRHVPREHQAVDERGQLTQAFGEPVRPEDGIRFDSPDSGILTDAADIIRRAIRLYAAASRAEDNPVPAVDLHNTGEDLTDEEIDALTSRWQAARARHGVGYSSRSLEVRALSTPPENLLLEGRREIALELARAVGVPAWAVDAPIDGQSLNYSNRASRNQELIDTALSPYMGAISARLSMPDVTPAGTSVKFNTDALTTPEPGDRYTALKTAIDAGIMTVDEARAMENLPPLEQEPTSENDA